MIRRIAAKPLPDKAFRFIHEQIIRQKQVDASLMHIYPNTA